MDQYKCMLIFLLSRLTSGHPPGHLKPLGAHTPAMLNIDTSDRFPSPEEFYESYVKPGRPLHLKNVLENIDFPPYQRWTDEYLKKHYGDQIVEVEMGKKENRKTGGTQVLKLSNFLDNYKNMNAYMVQDLPKKMGKDFRFPSSLMCGGFQKMVKLIVMWFSGGGTKSHLHLDNLDNINCLLDGKKDLVIIDKKHNHLVEADNYNVIGSFSDVDVDSVDMYKFPELQKVPWYKVNLNKGDCFYIPYHWHHQIYSHPGRNFAINIWFYHLWWLNKTNCEGIDHNATTTLPFKDFQEPLKVELHRQELLAVFYDKQFVTRKNFKFQMVDYKGDLDKVFDMIDLNNDDKLSWDELYSFGNDILETKFGKDLIEQFGTDDENDDENETRDESISEDTEKNIHKEDFDNKLEKEYIENVDDENIEIGDEKTDFDTTEIDNETGDSKRDEL